MSMGQNAIISYSKWQAGDGLSCFKESRSYEALGCPIAKHKPDIAEGRNSSASPSV
jgi:hypothetical protein